MKKNILIGAVIVGLILIVGGGIFMFGKKKNNSSNTNIETIKEVGQGEKVNEEKNSLAEEMEDQFSKIKKGEKMKCVYAIQMGDDEFNAETYVEGEKFKSISVIDAMETGKTFTIFDGKIMYNWIEGQKEGFKIGVDCAKELGEETETEAEAEAEAEAEESSVIGEVPSVDDIFENAVDVKCEPIKEIDFSIPSDVEFVDQCEMIRNQMKQIEEFNQSGQIPAMPEIPAGF